MKIESSAHSPFIKSQNLNTQTKNSTMYWQEQRNIDQWNRFEGLEVNPWIYSQLIFDKVSKNMQRKKGKHRKLKQKWANVIVYKSNSSS
jgi:hypothetical protein